MMSCNSGSSAFTMVTVTHDLKEALYLSDRIILISNRPARIIHQFVVNLKNPGNSPRLNSWPWKRNCSESSAGTNRVFHIFAFAYTAKHLLITFKGP